MGSQQNPGTSFRFNKTRWYLLGIVLSFCLCLWLYDLRNTIIKAPANTATQPIVVESLDTVFNQLAAVSNLRNEPHLAFFIRLIIFVALLETGLNFFKQRLRQWRFNFWLHPVRGHLVVIGLGNHGQQIVREALARGEAVAGIELLSDTAIETELAGARKNLFVKGNAEDSRTLALAGVHRAGRIVILGGKDENNVKLGTAAHKFVVTHGGTAQIIVGISSSAKAEMLQSLWCPTGAENKEKASVIRPVNFCSVAMRHILLEMGCKLGATAEIRQRGVSLLIVAPPDTSLDFLRHALSFLQLSADNDPRVTVCVPNATAKSFHRQFPEFERIATVSFVDVPILEAGRAIELESQTFDVALAAHDSGLETLMIADKLLANDRLQIAEVRAILPQGANLPVLDDPRLKVHSVFDLGRKSPEFGDDAFEREAEANHQAYVSGLDEPERLEWSKRPWTDLPESFREFNRWSVLSQKVKRAIWENVTEAEKPALLEQLAVCEHKRWMAEKIMNGWRAGGGGNGPQDKRYKLHPDIRPFTELSEATKEKDRVQVRQALRLGNMTKTTRP